MVLLLVLLVLLVAAVVVMVMLVVRRRRRKSRRRSRCGDGGTIRAASRVALAHRLEPKRKSGLIHQQICC